MVRLYSVDVAGHTVVIHFETDAEFRVIEPELPQAVGTGGGEDFFGDD